MKHILSITACLVVAIPCAMAQQGATPAQPGQAAQPTTPGATPDNSGRLGQPTSPGVLDQQNPAPGQPVQQSQPDRPLNQDRDDPFGRDDSRDVFDRNDQPGVLDRSNDAGTVNDNRPRPLNDRDRSLDRNDSLPNIQDQQQSNDPDGLDQSRQPGIWQDDAEQMRNSQDDNEIGESDWEFQQETREDFDRRFDGQDDDQRQR